MQIQSSYETDRALDLLERYSTTVQSVSVTGIDRRNGWVYFRQSTRVVPIPHTSPDNNRMPEPEFRKWCGLKPEEPLQDGLSLQYDPDLLPLKGQGGVLTLGRTDAYIKRMKDSIIDFM